MNVCTICNAQHDEPLEERADGQWSPRYCGRCRREIERREALMAPLAASLHHERQLARRLLRELAERCANADRRDAANALVAAADVLRDWDERAILAGEFRHERANALNRRW